jgi:hypothetical protein
LFQRRPESLVAAEYVVAESRVATHRLIGTFGRKIKRRSGTCRFAALSLVDRCAVFGARAAERRHFDLPFQGASRVNGEAACRLAAFTCERRV